MPRRLSGPRKKRKMEQPAKVRRQKEGSALRVGEQNQTSTNGGLKNAWGGKREARSQEQQQKRRVSPPTRLLSSRYRRGGGEGSTTQRPIPSP
mmetsp:Transcript_21862/g.52232  ORF Transcript_21862/g.52232 Transcript_21862/m.52232 type:complete len:93 (-) Transcript_21862:2333-2611(-)